ncbi:MAG: hypothetical protein QE271_02150 [Bacteriovoracaceae bacterium]|nr:hypothetical protein [Bacteriovoracaceae bacterium]
MSNTMIIVPPDCGDIRSQNYESSRQEFIKAKNNISTSANFVKYQKANCKNIIQVGQNTNDTLCQKAAVKIQGKMSAYEYETRNCSSWIESCHKQKIEGDYQAVHSEITNISMAIKDLGDLIKYLGSINDNDCGNNVKDAASLIDCPANDKDSSTPKKNYCDQIKLINENISKLNKQTNNCILPADIGNCNATARFNDGSPEDYGNENRQNSNIFMYCFDIKKIQLSGSLQNNFPAFCRQFFPLFPEMSQINYPGLLRWASSEGAICNGTDESNVSTQIPYVTRVTKEGTKVVNKKVRGELFSAFLSKNLALCEGMNRFYNYKLKNNFNQAAENYKANPEQASDTKLDTGFGKDLAKIECKETLYSVDNFACLRAKVALGSYSAGTIAQKVRSSKELQKAADEQLDKAKNIVDSGTGDKTVELTLNSYAGNIKAQNISMELADKEIREIWWALGTFGAIIGIWPIKFTALHKCKISAADSPFTPGNPENSCGVALNNSSTYPLILPNDAVRNVLLKTILELWTLINTTKQNKSAAEKAKLDLLAQEDAFKRSLWTPTPGPADPTPTTEVAQINCTNNPYMIGCGGATGGYKESPNTLGTTSGVIETPENGDGNPNSPGGSVPGNIADLDKKEVTWEDKASPGGGGGGGAGAGQGGPGSSAGGSSGGGGTSPGAAPTQPNGNVADKSGGGGSVLERSANYGGRGGRSTLTTASGYGSNGLGRRGGDDEKNPFGKMFGDKDGADGRGGIFGSGGDGDGSGTDRSIAEASDDDNLGYSNLFERITKTANAYYHKGRVGKAAPGSGNSSGKGSSGSGNNKKNPRDA